MRVIRKDQSLNDAIEVLDQYYERAGRDIEAANAMLHPSDNDFINGELAKCMQFPDYFIQNYYLIRTEDQELRALWPYREEQDIIVNTFDEEWERNGCCKVAIVKGRQFGGTTIVQARMFQHTIFHERNYTLIVAQDDGTARHIIEMSNTAYSFLPWWMKPEQKYKTKAEGITFQRENDDEITLNPGLGSILRISHAQKMSGVAIGRSVSAAHLSELSRWPQSDILETDLLPSMRAPNGFYVMESTGQGKDDPFYTYVTDIRHGDIEDWRLLFVPTYKVKRYSLPLKKGETITLTEKQQQFHDNVKKETGFTIPPEAWKFRLYGLRRKARVQAFKESYPWTIDEAFQNSGRCAFDLDALEEMKLVAPPAPAWIGEIKLQGKKPVMDGHEVPPGYDKLPVRKSGKGGKRLWIWEMPQAGENYYCLPDGELVRTSRGEKSIEDVSDDDLLLDKDGKFVKIKQRMRRKYSGEVVAIRPHGSITPTRFTLEHPIWISDSLKGQCRWVDARDVKPGQWVHLPIPKRSVIGGRELMNKWPNDAVRIDFRIDPAILWSVDFWWIVGLWLGDGWAREKDNMATINISFNKKTERWIAEKGQRIIDDLTGRTPRIEEKRSTVELAWSSVQWVRFLHSNFGTDCYNKTVPEWVKNLPREHRLALLEGYYLSDGSVVRVNKKHKTSRAVREHLNFVSVSRGLLAGVQDILASLGYMGVCGVLREAGVTEFPSQRWYATRRTYRLNVNFSDTRKLLREWGHKDTGYLHDPQKIYNCNDGDFIHSRIYSVEREQYDGYVNNFETETHTYCAGLIATHNCGSDAAGGNGGDYSCCQVFRLGVGFDERGRPNKDVQVAEWWGWESPKRFAKIVMAIGYLYGTCEISNEYQGPGITTGDAIVDADYPNLWRPRHKDRTKITFTPFVHWVTTIKTRDLIISEMQDALLMDNVVINSHDLLEEMGNFATLNEGGRERYEGIDSKDDGVLASTICLYCMRQAFQYEKESPADGQTRPSLVDPNNPNPLWGVIPFEWTGPWVVRNMAMQIVGGKVYHARADADNVASRTPGTKVMPHWAFAAANPFVSPLHQQSPQGYWGSNIQYQAKRVLELSDTQVTPTVVEAYKRWQQTVRDAVPMESGGYADDW